MDRRATSAPDLRKTVPRSGRHQIGGYAWLARLADKVRAEHAGLQGDYIGYCPFSMEFLERAGISRDAFDELIRRGATDDELVTYFDAHVSAQRKNALNRWVLVDLKRNLDSQDREEGRLAA